MVVQALCYGDLSLTIVLCLFNGYQESSIRLKTLEMLEEVMVLYAEEEMTLKWML